MSKCFRFNVDPINQQKLVDLRPLATESGSRKVTGFISSSVRGSIDGTKITIDAQWKKFYSFTLFRRSSCTSQV
jgi:hypothetical protein